MIAILALYALGYILTGIIVVYKKPDFKFVEFAALILFCLAWPVLWFNALRATFAEFRSR